jgi:hypothetical protein
VTETVYTDPDFFSSDWIRAHGPPDAEPVHLALKPKAGGSIRQLDVKARFDKWSGQLTFFNWAVRQLKGEHGDTLWIDYRDRGGFSKAYRVVDAAVHYGSIQRVPESTFRYEGVDA